MEWNACGRMGGDAADAVDEASARRPKRRRCVLIITVARSRVEFLLVGFVKWKERERGMRRLSMPEVTRLRGSCGICPHVMRDTKNESRRQVNECIMRLLCCFVVYSWLSTRFTRASQPRRQRHHFTFTFFSCLFLLPVLPPSAAPSVHLHSPGPGRCTAGCAGTSASPGCCTASAGGCARCKVRGGRRLRFLKGSPPPTLSHTHVYPIF